ncbi:MAG TPA: alpha/beta hydrolase domain-containing protein [Vicinamibacterales bacterium]|nr:alpha/beta hydrolase domain-containing protein [Vicinamibacterales bacterium]
MASAEVVRIDVRSREDFGTHERVIGRVHYAVDPKLPQNQAVTDLAAAPRNAAGTVEFAGDLLIFLPKPSANARGTVFLEVVNRGRDQSLGLMSEARQRDLAPENWNLGDRFLLEQGFTVAFLGWQFDVQAGDGLTLSVPTAPVNGVVRASAVTVSRSGPGGWLGLSYCASDASQPDATLTFRSVIVAQPTVLARESWQFAPDGCSVRRPAGFDAGLNEVIYRATGSPVAGLGLAAVRDFASYLKHGGAVTTLRENPALMRRVIGFGYSQSGRFLREFVRDGFNQDERGRAAFDGLMIASAGAGGGSFNHRFASPGQAGNSVLSIFRPVDLPPFNDDGLLAKATAASVVPRIFYTFSSTEYWARAGSLTHTNETGTADVPLAPTSRLYFLSGTPHASGGLPPAPQQTRYSLNFAQQRWVLRALLIDLDKWLTGTDPPPSRYPTIARRQLVPRESVRFPKVPSLPFAEYMPGVWRMDYGVEYATTRVITREPPSLGEPYPVLVPQVNADGNDEGGIPSPEVAVPLGTHTGWNVSTFQLSGLRYLAGLVGSFQPFARTKAEREQSGDSRPSIEERYASRQEYLQRVRRVATDLVRERFVLQDDVEGVVQQAERTWSVIVGR